MEKTTKAMSQSPTLWCITCSGMAFLASATFFFFKGMLSFNTIITSLAAGFFVGSIIFSTLSLLQHTGPHANKVIGTYLALSLVMGAIVGAPFFFFKTPAKALEIMMIISGIASLLFGAYFENKSP